MPCRKEGVLFDLVSFEVNVRCGGCLFTGAQSQTYVCAQGVHTRVHQYLYANVCVYLFIVIDPS